MIRSKTAICALAAHLAAVMIMLVPGEALAYDVVDCPSCVLSTTTMSGVLNGAIAAVGVGVSTVGSSLTTMMATLKSLGSGNNQTAVATGKMQAETTIAATANSQTAAVDRQYRVGNPCGVGAASAGGADIKYGRVADAAAIGRGKPMNVGGSYAGAGPQLTNAINWSKGDTPAPAPEIQAVTGAVAGCSGFASKGLRADQCKKAGFDPKNEVGFADADVIAETLLDGPQADLSKPVKRLTVDMSGKDKTAIEAYVRHLEAPLGLRTLEKGELNSQAGRIYMSLLDDYNARMSLAGRATRRHVTSIAAEPMTKLVLSRLLKSTVDADFIKADLDKQFPEWSTKGISEDQLDQLEVDRRYRNPAWYQQLVNSRDEIPLEQVQLQALMANQNRQIITELRELSIAVGELLASQTRAELRPKLEEAFRAAASR